MIGDGPIGVGIAGGGVISSEYLENLMQFADVEVRMVADIALDRAQAQAEAFGVPSAGSVADMLARDDIDIIANLTVPAVHAETGHRIIDAGKHVWSEKPLALDSVSARGLLAAAQAASLRVGCAPDTMLGAGIQSALRAIARGDIGEPLTATTIFHVPGPETWHPNPDFLFAAGAGPLFDMGPYYVTALVHAFGSASRVQAVSSKSVDRRTIGSGPRAGASFPVEVPTHHAALIQFRGGQSAQSTFSFQHALPRDGLIEINGTLGTISLPDPNTFEGDSTLWRHGEEHPVTIPARGSTWSRGTGIVELARAIRAGVPERASGIVASHVLDVLLAVRDAAASGSAVDVDSVVDPIAPLPEDFDPAAPTLN